MESLAGQSNKERVQRIDSIINSSGNINKNSGVVAHHVSGHSVITGTTNIKVYSASTPARSGQSKKSKRSSAQPKYLPRIEDAPHIETASSSASHSGPVIPVEEAVDLKISDYDPGRALWDLSHHKCPQTTQWILKNEKYVAWASRNASRCLWLTGCLGSGKSLLATTIVAQLISHREENELVAHFFFRENHETFISAAGLIDSFVSQILQHLQDDGNTDVVPEEVRTWICRFYGPSPELASPEEIVDRVLLPLCATLGQATFIVDGIDICNMEHTWRLLKLFSTLLDAVAGVRVLIVSREDTDVASSIDETATITISLGDVIADIKTFIGWKVSKKLKERCITEKPTTITAIKARLAAKAEKMILWVSLQIDAIWQSCSGDASILAALDRLPEDLKETYSRCLQRINSDQASTAGKILGWVSVARHPFSMLQLREALAVDSETGIIQDDEMPSAQDTLRSCGNLISEDTDGTILFAHQSVRQFLEDNSGTKPDSLFPTGRNRVQANCELGILCIRHLASSAHTMDIITMNDATATRAHFQPVMQPLVDQLIAAHPATRWFSWLTSTRRHANISISTDIPRQQPTKDPPSFFVFASKQWTESSRQFSDFSLIDADFIRFKELAIKAHVRSEVRPWQIVSDILNSNESALLGWSILNDHQALFSLIAHNQSPRKLRQGLLGEPLNPFGGLNLLQLAVRCSDKSFLDVLLPLAERAELEAEDSSQQDLLWHAVDMQKSRVVEVLLKRGVPIKRADQKGSALALAIEQGSFELCQTLFQGDKAIEISRPAIIIAIEHAQCDILRYFLQHNLFRGLQDYLDLDPDLLLRIARMGHINVIGIILSDGRAHGWKFNRLWHRLAYVISTEQFPSEVVFKLCDAQILKSGDYRKIWDSLLHFNQNSLVEAVLARLAEQDRFSPDKPLEGLWILAVAQDDVESLQRLFRLGPGVAAGFDYQELALYAAVTHGTTETVHSLLDMDIVKATSDTVSPFWSSKQTTPVLLAFNRKRIQILKSLLSSGASILLPWKDEADGRITTVLHLAVKQQDSVMTELMLTFERILEHVDTALMVAISCRSWACADLLISHGACFGYPDQGEQRYDEGHQALANFISRIEATRSVSWPVLIKLIDGRWLGETHLIRAIEYGSFKLVAWLVQVGADVNVQAQNILHRRGRRPLHLAIRACSPELLDTLLASNRIETHHADMQPRNLYQVARNYADCSQGRAIFIRLREEGLIDTLLD